MTKQVKKSKHVGVMNVLGTDWKLVLHQFQEPADGAAALYGFCCPETNEIHVNSTKDGAGYPDTLLHEVIHAIDAVADLGLTEAQVRATATSLRGFFRANPKLAQWLIA